MYQQMWKNSNLNKSWAKINDLYVVKMDFYLFDVM